MILKLPSSTTFETSMILNCTLAPLELSFSRQNPSQKGHSRAIQSIYLKKSLLMVTSSYPRMNISHKNWRFYAQTESSVYWLLQDHSSNPILSLLFFQLAVFFRFSGLNLAWSHSGFLEGVILPFKFWNSSFFFFGKFLTLFTCNWEG